LRFRYTYRFHRLGPCLIPGVIDGEEVLCCLFQRVELVECVCVELVIVRVALCAALTNELVAIQLVPILLPTPIVILQLVILLTLKAI
jgi:hypothetical protein